MRIFLFLFLLSCGGFVEAETQVLVSIAPQKFLVETIGGEHVSVTVIVPPGANSHTYEPTPRQVVSAQKGDVWFRLGESFESRMIPSLSKQTLIVDQREGIDLLKKGCGCCHSHDAHDPHIWLSARLLKKMAAQIAHKLCEMDPTHQTEYSNNLTMLEEQLNQLDLECTTLFSSSTQKYILVSHPAFGYLCHDYGLEQLSIEMEGREPTPRYLTDLIQQAKNLQIKHVFLQLQHNPKGGKRIAKELGAETLYVDPYVENVIENLRSIAQLFSNS